MRQVAPLYMSESASKQQLHSSSSIQNLSNAQSNEQLKISFKEQQRRMNELSKVKEKKKPEEQVKKP